MRFPGGLCGGDGNGDRAEPKAGKSRAVADGRRARGSIAFLQRVSIERAAHTHVMAVAIFDRMMWCFWYSIDDLVRVGCGSSNFVQEIPPTPRDDSQPPRLANPLRDALADPDQFRELFRALSPWVKLCIRRDQLVWTGKRRGSSPRESSTVRSSLWPPPAAAGLSGRFEIERVHYWGWRLIWAIRRSNPLFLRGGD